MGDMRHFLRGRTGANSVLNKEKISVQFPPHPTSSHEIHRDTTFFPSSPFLFSSPIVFYKSDIINQILAASQSRRSNDNTT